MGDQLRPDRCQQYQGVRDSCPPHQERVPHIIANDFKGLPEVGVNMWGIEGVGGSRWDSLALPAPRIFAVAGLAGYFCRFPSPTSPTSGVLAYKPLFFNNIIWGT